MRRRFTLAFLALAALAPSLAGADPVDDRAHDQYLRGERLFAEGRFGEALEAYRAAYALRALPGFLFNIGQCHRNLGDLDEALAAFRGYLRREPDADNRPAVEALIEEIEHTLAARKALEPPASPAASASGEAPRVPPPGQPALTAAPPPDEARPITSRWWFWTAAAAIVAGAATAIAIASHDSSSPQAQPSPPVTTLGTIAFPP